jgi:hypothetical protein
LFRGSQNISLISRNENPKIGCVHSFDENLPGRPPIKPPTGWSKNAVGGSEKGLTGAEGGGVDGGNGSEGEESTGRSRRVNGSGG